jgi:putative colanic acid biosynthesis acetyltransferase WcaF
MANHKDLKITSKKVELIHVSPFTFKENMGRVLWSITQATVFRFSPKLLYGFRRGLLRCFGAKIGRYTTIRPTVRIEIPWNLIMEDHSTIGDFATIYNFDIVRLGLYATVSQHAYLCTGTHETESLDMKLITAPIILGERSWVAAHSFVGPGVTLGRYAILGAKSSLFKDLGEKDIAVGCPAKVIKKRELR